MMALTVSLLCLVLHGYEDVLPILVGFGVLGFVDDLLTVPAAPRLVGQIVLSAGMAVTIDFPVAGAAAVLALFGAALWVVTYTNALNFMDGINGITAMHLIMTGGWFVWLIHSAGDSFLSIMAAAIAGSAIGFLPFNVPVARVFLGDAGSYFFGAALAFLAATSLVQDVSLVRVGAPFVIYIADTGWTMVRRISRQEHLMEAHRSHVYQRLSDRLGHLLTSLAVLFFSVLLLASSSWPIFPLITAWAVIIICYLTSPKWVGILSA